MNAYTVISPTSCMGLVGINEEAYQEALSRDPDAVAADAGSLDPGPHYLGAGLPHVARFQMKHDCRVMMGGLRQRKTPIVMGSAGGSGGRPHIEWQFKIMDEVAHEMGQTFKVAVIDTTFEKDYLKKMLRKGKITPLQHDKSLTERDIDHATEIVAQIGVEPIIQALDMNPDIVLAGRACDNACFAADPVRKGYDKGLALHLGKIVECASAGAIPLRGAQLRVPMIGTLFKDYFLVEPASQNWICTIRSVVGHEVYERADPTRQLEPGGLLDMRGARFEQFSDRTVKVSGSKWVQDQTGYKVKLEGAEKVGYRSLFIGGARDPAYLRNIDWILNFAKQRIIDEFDKKGLAAGKDYHIVYHVYGKNGTMGPLEPQQEITSNELGIILEIVAETQELAEEICYFGKYGLVWCNFEGRVTTAGNLAYPYSPSILATGPVYRLNVHHLLDIEDPCMFPIKIVEVGK
jgi:hypothetical protein